MSRSTSPTVSSEGEDSLIRFLKDPSSYAHAPSSVRLVQTHISYVALASPFVFKVKKPVDFGFLDFTTLERRRHYCEEEVRLNRRLCARIYEGVVPIARGAQGLTFGDEGEVVEYAVRMRELEDGRFLHQLLARGAAGPADLDRVVAKLLPFYRRQTPAPEVTAWGRLKKLRISTDENFEQTERFVGEALPRPAFEALRYFTERFYAARRALLERRCEEGHIVDAHGDLHAEHIHLTAEDVCIYDCIEFNERLRYIDVASDVAFLTMDLAFNGHPELSRYLAAQMAARLQDPDLRRLLGFYGCYRAYVRAKVELMRSAEAEVPAEDRAESRDRAARYVQLALRYAVAGGRKMVFVVMGRVGTGKSTVARRLSELLGREVVSSDRLRKTMAGVPLRERGTAEERARLYAPEHTARVYAALRDRALENAAAGRSTILDATYSRLEHRAALRTALQEQDLPCRFIELTAPDARLRERLQARDHTQTVSDARLEDFEPLDAHYEAPDAAQEPDVLQVSTEPSPEETLRNLLGALADHEIEEDR